MEELKLNYSIDDIIKLQEFVVGQAKKSLQKKSVVDFQKDILVVLKAFKQITNE